MSIYRVTDTDVLQFIQFKNSIDSEITLKFDLTLEVESNLLIRDLTQHLDVKKISFLSLYSLYNKGDLPEGVETLDFNCGVNPFPVGMVPSSVKHIYFASNESGIDMGKDHLPAGLRVLSVYDLSVNGITSLNELRFLKVLNIGLFEHPLDTPLPSTLEEVSLYRFNQPIAQGVLPQGLKSFSFGGDFNRQLCPGMLPDSLTELGLSGKVETYKDQLDQILPKSLLKIHFQYFLSPLYIGFLPEGVETIHPLYLHVNNPEILVGALPHKLKTLVFGNQRCLLHKNAIPASVTHLSLSPTFNRELIDGQDGQRLLPPNLTHLVFPGEYKKQIPRNSLPNTLKHLSLSVYKQPIEPNVLPSSIHTLNFDCALPALTANIIPPSVQKIAFSVEFATYIEPGALSSNITEISFVNVYPHPMPHGVLPPTLKKLRISCPHLADIVLPNSLTNLTLELIKDQTLHQGFLPPSLTALSLCAMGSGLNPSTLKKEYFPPTLKCLKLSQIQFALQVDMIPPTVRSLDLGLWYDKSINIHSIPPSVKFLYLPQDYDLKKLSLQSTTTIPILGQCLYSKDDSNK
ncbi:hypothetical protein CYY_005527 [Polysphondylium violaceum]|uniref:Uncharacterized protein n=1 Tax=Polysphondylium violaceum TaxID=133409 RepID=A0A8J4PUY6_9MYCE|nr:hypothetical protein CYY_005527 [Polysphondylium violaceum]